MSKELVIVRDYHLGAGNLRKAHEAMLGQVVKSMGTLLGFMDEVFFLLSEGIGEPKPTKNQNDGDVVHLLVSRAFKHHRSIRSLLSEGLEQDALALLRNFVETIMTIKYLATDSTGTLASRFREFQDVERYKNLIKNRDLEPSWLPMGGQAEVDRVTSARAAFAKKYGSTDSWHGFHPIDKLASQRGVDMLDDYVKAFRAFCLFNHPSFLSAKDYTDARGALGWGPSAKRAFSLVSMSTTYLVKAVETYVAHLGLESQKAANILHEVRSNLVAKNQEHGYSGKDFTVEVKDAVWGTLPASQQPDLKPKG